MTPDLRARSIALLTGAATGGARPAAIGQKFTDAGDVLPFSGNTFLCHIPQGPLHEAVTAASRALQAGPFAGAFHFLPAPSFHMTVLEGVCDTHRDAARWPQGLSTNLPVADVTAHFLPRVSNLTLPQTCVVQPLGIFGGFSIDLTGATDADEASLRTTRDALRDATGLHLPDHDTYGFHITLAYPLRWLLPEQAAAVMYLAGSVAADLMRAAPVFTLGPVELCRFENMHAFPVIARLS